jgi:hypothetical protein
VGSPVPDGFNAKCPSYSANVNDTKGEVWQAMPTDEHGEGSWFMATFGKPVTVGCIKVQVPPHYASECVGLKKACEPHTSTLSTCRPVTLSLALSLLAFTPPPPLRLSRLLPWRALPYHSLISLSRSPFAPLRACPPSSTSFPVPSLNRFVRKRLPKQLSLQRDLRRRRTVRRMLHSDRVARPVQCTATSPCRGLRRAVRVCGPLVEAGRPERG